MVKYQKELVRDKIKLKEEQTVNIHDEKVNYPPSRPVRVSVLHIEKYGPHYHSSDLEIIFCLKGTVTVKCAVETIKLKEGGFFTASHGDIHTITGNTTDNTVVLFHLDLLALSKPWQTLKKEIFVFENTSGEPVLLTDPSYEKCLDILLFLAFITVSPGRADSDDIFINAAECLINILTGNFTYVNYVRKDHELPQNARALIDELYTYVFNNYTGKISISTLSEHTHFSKTYLADFIKSNSLLTLNEILNYLRCAYAEKLLLTTDKSNLEITYECGFSDSKYFYSHFRKWYGTTPQQHKEWYKNFCKKPDKYQPVQKTEAELLIKEYYCQYHSNKMLEMLLQT